MGRVISMPGDAHQQVQALLPWYVNGTLDEGEMAAVEAHLATCAECREDLAMDRAIGRQDTAALPLDVERGWAALRSRIDRTPAPEAMRVPEAMPAPGQADNVVPLRKSWLQRSVPMRWALAAQAAAAVLIVGAGRLMIPAAAPEPLYHALGSAPQSAPGNMVVIFRPDTMERDLRGAMVASGAELVGGPTASDAYVLRVAATGRDTALARLRANAHVMLAEPIDGSARP
jgi:anti-sigma-K factor RskA